MGSGPGSGVPRRAGRGGAAASTWGGRQTWGGLAAHAADGEECLPQVQEKPSCSHLRAPRAGLAWKRSRDEGALVSAASSPPGPPRPGAPGPIPGADGRGRTVVPPSRGSLGVISFQS